MQQDPRWVARRVPWADVSPTASILDPLRRSTPEVRPWSQVFSNGVQHGPEHK